MTSLRVAGGQIPVTRDIEANMGAILRAIEFAGERGADVLLTPEGALSGYTCRFDQKQVCRALEAVLEAATSLQVGLALGTCYREDDGRCHDQIRFYGPDGEFLGFHSKILLCGTLTDPPEGEINEYDTSPLGSISFHGVRVGGLVCNDMWANPQCTPMPDAHLSQQLSQMGASIILHAVNGGRDDHAFHRDVIRPFYEANLRMRARAGRIWIVTVDNCHPTDVGCSSPSGVITPEGEWAHKSPYSGEHLFCHTIELD